MEGYRRLTDLELGTPVVVEHWGEFMEGKVAEMPEWSHQGHQNYISVEIEGEAKLYAPSSIWIKEA